MDLRPYQARAVEWTLDTWATLRRQVRRTSVVVQAPTGAGKGVMMGALSPDLVIAPGIDLVRQLSSRIPSALVVTVQDLAARLRRGEPLPLAKRVAVDEGRWICAPAWGPIAEHYINGGSEVGIFDATPATASGMGLGRWAEELYQVASMRELIADGHLVPYRVMAPSEPQSELCATPYQAWSWQTPGETAVVFCRDKAHATETCEDFARCDVSAAIITDESTPAERRWLLGYVGEDGQWVPGALARGDVKVAVCAQILRQGIDVPRVSSIILARATGSIPLYLQAVGRGGRPFDGKSTCTVLDLRGAVHAHGVPETDRVWSLEGEAVRPRDKLPGCVQCSQCGVWHEGGVCRLCGGAPVPPSPPRVRAADLIEMRALEGDDRKRATLERYVREAIAKGHNPISARYRYRGVYGQFPPPSWLSLAISAASGRASRDGRADAREAVADYGQVSKA